MDSKAEKSAQKLGHEDRISITDKPCLLISFVHPNPQMTMLLEA